MDSLILCRGLCRDERCNSCRLGLDEAELSGSGDRCATSGSPLCRRIEQSPLLAAVDYRSASSDGMCAYQRDHRSLVRGAILLRSGGALVTTQNGGASLRSNGELAGTA